MKEKISIENSPCQQTINENPATQKINFLQFIAFFECIATGKQTKAEAILKENPEFTEYYGSILLDSDHLVSNVTAVQLAYILDDLDMCKMIVASMDAKGKKLAKEQIAQKRLEINEQTIKFDLFENLCMSITKDTDLQTIDMANDTTLQTLKTFQEQFMPGEVTRGKPFDIRHLWYAYDLYSHHQHYTPLWEENQNMFFIKKVIVFLQCLSSTFYAQAFSQGLHNIVNTGEPLRRSTLLKNNTEEDIPTHFPLDSSCQFFAEIYHGCAINFDSAGTGLGSGGWCTEHSRTLSRKTCKPWSNLTLKH